MPLDRSAKRAPIRGQDGIVLGARHLYRAELLRSTAHPQFASGGDAEVARPVGIAASGNEVAGAGELERRADRDSARLTSASASHGQQRS